MITDEMTYEERCELLISNTLEWYLVDNEDGTTELVHETGLSSILQCGYPASEFGIAEMTQCWNGEDLSDET